MKISVVTPSFNQGKFIERTIQSVISQKGDFDLEYVVVDGGSTDETLDILKKYESSLIWKSEADEGQSDAINKAFEMTTGEVLGWLNSDDTYMPGALSCVAEEYRKSPFVWCFGNCKIINENDEEIRRFITWYKVLQSKKYSYKRLIRRDFISQPATFFASSAYHEMGEMGRELIYSMDYDCWLRMGKMHAPRYIDAWLANFRWYQESKNGSLYTRAAWEAYQTAKRNANSSERLDVMMHFVHYHLLRILYRFM